MNTIRKSKIFLNSIILGLLILVSIFFIITSSVFAANPQFNYMVNDLKTVRLGNYTASSGSLSWNGTISAVAGDRIVVDVYYHNGVVGTVANNTRMRINFPTNSGTQMVFSGTLWADNAAQVNDVATLNISSAQTVIPENQARWLPNQVLTSDIMIPAVNNGNSVEVNIGDVAGGWASQGHVMFYFNISNGGNPIANNPVVNTGVDITINELQSTNLSASVSSPLNLSMTYAWTCTGGSLSSSTILSPVYTAPSVSVNTTHVCTLVATDSNGNVGSDSINIIVNDNIPPNPNDPVVNAGIDVSANESQSISLLASASDPHGLAMTYAWTCNGGSLSSTTILNPIYTAPSVTINTIYTCTFTARNSNGNASSDTVNINVLNVSSGGGGGGSPSISVSLSVNPSRGTAPLNGVDLIANTNTWSIADNRVITYLFDCDGNGSFELRADTVNRSYTAVDLCNYTSDGSYTAKVKVISDGSESWNQANIIVGPMSGSINGISVDAGLNKDIGENQSVLLNGYTSSQFGYALSYYWTCNGGSIINANTLTPAYYAPSVNVDTTYACTLYTTDSRGYRNSDMVNIVVRNTGANGYTTGLKTTTILPDISNVSATLKGTLDNDGGRLSSVRFNWGKLSLYNNFTPWTTDKTTGQAFNYYISGLEKGKAYHYRAEASNGRETVMGQDVVFMTKPDIITKFYAVSTGSGQISLKWNKGDASCYTMITRRAGSYPVNSNDGTIVYYGTASSYIDKNLSNDVWYYYRAWSVGCDEGYISYSDGQNAKAYAVAGKTSYIAPVIETVKKEEVVVADVLIRDATQNEIAWQNSIVSSPDDEIEFKVIITPTGERSLENVVLKAVLSDKISSIKDIKVSDESYNGNLSSDLKLGTIALGESKIITFKGKIDGRQSFDYGSNVITNTVEIMAKGNATVKKTVTIDVTRSVESEAGLISLIDLRAYAGILTILFIILLIIVMYLLIERKKGKECLTEKAASIKVEKSKYFNIK
ncbi:MAG: hypothetical protein WC319_03895 [Candidatus Paceibacterota bacterium]|jgi:hypothetical protein